MELSGSGKSPNSSLSFRYNANNEELEELYQVCEDDPPTPHEPSPKGSENASPKRTDKSSSIVDKYFKSMRAEKNVQKPEDKPSESKVADENRSPVKEVTASPVKEYLNRLSKRGTPEVTPEVKEGSNETWKIFHDFKFKIAQAVEDMKTRSLEDSKEKPVPRENSTSDSEDNSAIKDSDLSVGDTDNQVSSLESSIQNLSEMSQPVTAKHTDPIYPVDVRNISYSSDDTHTNFAHHDLLDIKREIVNGSNLLDVESGVEAMEEGLDGFGDLSQIDTHSCKQVETVPTQSPSTPPNFSFTPSKSILHKKQETVEPKIYFLNFTMYFLTFLVLLNYILFPGLNIWNGFLLGIWFFCFASNVKQWFLDNYFSDWEPSRNSFFMLKRSSALPVIYTIPSVKEHTPMKKYEGWINHYRYPEYDPYTYHINKSTTAFMKLEGCNLRISYTRVKIAKRALWSEKIENIVFYQHRLYNLTGARVILLPKGLVRRRQWSKKYPICIILSENEIIQVLEKENAPADKKTTENVTEKKKDSLTPPETESAETNTSPEKKKKFVWRRREKSISHAETEVGKEGLRHRIVRKMHREKKTDNVTTYTELPDGETVQIDKTEKREEASFYDAESEFTARSNTEVGELELDEAELARIKDFLEEAEPSGEGPAESEWSVHLKHSTDTHSRLFFFARTGRDKHEWFRKLNTAISDAKTAASAESSAAEEKSKETSDSPDTKEGIETALYKVSEKDTIAFGKTSKTSKLIDTLPDDVTVTPPLQPTPYDMSSYEKTFWPFLLKIIQTHEKRYRSTSEAGVMCQIEPTPHERAKHKKKRKDAKTPANDCECRMLPAEMTWVNTVLARLVYDVTRDSRLIERLQNRIQRKLHTLKLPSFMSPLVVTELSLAGACPLVERVSPPAWDERGVWLDADLRYDGGAYISILTQINLMKLKEKNVTLEDHIKDANETLRLSDHEAFDSATGLLHTEKQQRHKRIPAAFDSDMEDSAESSSDDESPPLQPVDSGLNLAGAGASESTLSDAVPASSKKKFLRMVDKIATNKYFQQVTDYKYVKRAMEGLSNTDIKLQLEIQGLEGRLALNLPPPPHDRIWIGFRTNPQLVLKARPAVGARALRFTHITNWIEQKLSKEFEKVLVLPNMEDIMIDIMTATPVDFE